MPAKILNTSKSVRPDFSSSRPSRFSPYGDPQKARPHVPTIFSGAARKNVSSTGTGKGSGKTRDYEWDVKSFFTIYKIEIAIEVEDPVTNSVRSGLDESTLEVTLNDTAVSIEDMAIERTKEQINGEEETVKMVIKYLAPSNLLNTNGQNTVKLDISDKVKNPLETVTKTFTIIRKRKE